MEKTHWVMDYETISNCFVAVFIDVKSDNTEIFVCHDLRNDFDKFVEFLKRNILYNEWHVSYNGLAFDAQITEYIIANAESLNSMSGCEIAKWIYQKAQQVITAKNNNEFLEFYEKNMHINQVDLFKLNHWDNPAKRSSLKWIQYSMDWHNVLDMPIEHTANITTHDEIDEIIEYCINDVKSTKAIMYLSKKQIALRKTLTEQYDIPLFSASEPRISKELFLHFLSEKTGIKKYELKQLRTNRTQIVVKDLILPYVKFETATFQKLLSRFNEITVYPEHTKGGFKYSINYKGVKTDFGLGGIHGAKTSGVYEKNENTIIMTSDVVSYYPNLAIRNGWSPAHLPSHDFCELYEWFFDERKKIPKSDPRNYVYKIILNSTYGLSNDKHSFLYDPDFTMRITINGQLSLCMLYEMITERIPGAEPLMQNTDGLETIIPKEYEEEYLKICEEWEQITNLKLEHDKYSKLILGDVNNYIAITEFTEVDHDNYVKLKKDAPHYVYKEENGKYYYQASKCKGRFEFNDLALHKNKSFLIIPKTIYYYFVHGIDPEDYMKTQTNIFDFCAGKKIKGNWEFIQHYVKPKIDPEYENYSKEQKVKYLLANGWEQSWSDDNWVRSDAEYKEANNGCPTEAAFKQAAPKVGEYSYEPLQKTLRYFISNKGSKILKTNKGDNRTTQIEAGKWHQHLMMNFVEKPFTEYDLDMRYYIESVIKELKKLEPKVTNQLTLF
jgi:hypothetical protein